MSRMEGIVGQPPRTRRSFKPILWWAGGIFGGLLLLVALLFGFMLYRMNYIPADLDTSTTKLSSQGLYRASYVPRLEPIRINQLHSWTIHVENADGQPVEGAQIAVDGDMPQHGHGLPTKSLVTRDLGNGDYLVEGMKFQMTGWWYVQFDISVDQKQDTVRFDFVLK